MNSFYNSYQALLERYSVIGILIVFTFTVGVSKYGGFADYVLVTLLCSVLYLVLKRPNISLSEKEKLFVLGSFAFPLVIVLSMYVHGNVDWRHFDNPSRLILVLPIYLAVRASNFSIAYLHWGIVLGAIIVGISAFVQREYLGVNRVYGYISDHNHSPISFGNMALMLAVLSPLCIHGIKMVVGRVGYLIVFLALSFGIYASLVSGTRGGWVSLPFIAILLFAPWRRKGLFLHISILLLVLFLFTLVYFFEPSVNVRINSMFHELYNIIVLGNWTGGSVGARFEMWYAASLAFWQSPIFGNGLGSYYEIKSELINQGLVLSQVKIYRYAHNEPLHYLSETGLFGFMGLFLYYFGGLALSYSKRHKHKEVALMGLLILIFRFDISLTQVQFIYHFDALFYIFLFAIIAGFMGRPSNSHTA